MAGAIQIPWASIINTVSSITGGSLGIASSSVVEDGKAACADAAYDAQKNKQLAQAAAQDQAQVMLSEADCMETPTEKYFMGRPESETA